MLCPVCRSPNVEYRVGVTGDPTFRQYHCKACDHIGSGTRNSAEDQAWRFQQFQLAGADTTCPACGGMATIIRAKLVCNACHQIVMTCCD